MNNNIILRYSFFLIPWNIQVNYYIEKKSNWKYILKDWLFETILDNQTKIEIIENKIKELLIMYKNKWYEIRNKEKKISDTDITKLFKIKFWKKKYSISLLEKDRFNYYISDNTTIDANWQQKIERNIIFFTKGIEEYIWRFTISSLDKYSLSIWSIYVTPSKQRLGYFSYVINNDIFNFIDKNIDELYAFSILEKWLWFYEKMNKQWKFKFMDNNHNWKFLLKAISSSFK